MRIKCAAIYFKGKLYTGTAHADIITEMMHAGVTGVPQNTADACYGFLTEGGCFVRRAAALEIAVKAGQVVRGKTIWPNALSSADLK